MKTYLYQHIRNDDMTVFYVGIGKRNRPYQSDNRNQYWHNIVNSVGYHVEVIKEFDSWQEAADWERFLIAIYGKRICGDGCLVNMTDGGEGSLGRTNELHPFYGKKRPDHSLKLKGRPNPQKSIEMSGENHFFFGKPVTEERRRNISRARKGKATGKDNGFYGKSHKAETISIISETNSKAIVCTITGKVIYKSLREASKALSIKETTLSARLRGRNKNNMSLSYYEDYINKNK